MIKESRRILVSQLVKNEGQVEWLGRNPRQWTKEDVDRTAHSIDEDPDFLDERPLLVLKLDDKHFLVFAGNLRLEGAKALKMRSVPSVVYYPVTEEDRQAVRRRALKDNGSFGKHDPDILANEWDDLPLDEMGINIPDWETPEDAEDETLQATEDDFDEEKDGILVRCKPGDVWQLGEHRLMCGDSTDLETVKKLMGGGGIMADMVFTDPPYGVAIGSKNKAINEVESGRGGRIQEDIANDTLPVDELYEVLKAAMTNVRLNCKPDACYFVCSPPGGDFGLMMMMMRDAGLRCRHHIVWAKDSATFSLGRLDYDYQHEAILYTWTDKHHNYRGGKFRTSVWNIPRPKQSKLHPTMKPVELVANCILDGTKAGDVILDAFGGSGTTIVAAEQLGRKCYTMELDPHYCDVILSRWEKLTGRQAVLLEN